MNRYHSIKLWTTAADLSPVHEKRRSLPSYRNTRNAFKSEFRLEALPTLAEMLAVEMWQARIEGRSKSPSNSETVLRSALKQFFATPDLGIFQARLVFQWKGTQQRENMGCSASYGFNGGKGHFRISFRPEIPNPETAADLKEALEILQALDDLGFGTFSREELIANKPHESAVYFVRGLDQIAVQIAEITPDAVDRMLAVAERFGSGKIFWSGWNFQTAEFKSTSESANRLVRQLSKDKPKADIYEVELGYRIEKLENYELPRAFCAEGEAFPHPIAEFKPSRKKCLLCIHVSREGYQFGLHTNEALNESQFEEIEKTLGIEFERKPYRRT